MRYMVMHKVDAHMEAGKPPSQEIIEGMGRYVGAAIQSGVFKDGAGLHPSSQRVRVVVRGGERTVTRGPYPGGNELLAGFTMVRADSIDHAIEIAARLATAAGGGEIEIGPVVEPWDIGVAPRPADPPKRFLLLRKADAAFEAGAAPPAAIAAVHEELAKAGLLLSSAALRPSRAGARLGKARRWTDGPFAESKELVAGFSIIEVPSLAEARRWADGYREILGDNEVDVREVA